MNTQKEEAFEKISGGHKQHLLIGIAFDSS
jgi:hypothetical protein